MTGPRDDVLSSFCCTRAVSATKPWSWRSHSRRPLARGGHRAPQGCPMPPPRFLPQLQGYYLLMMMAPL